MTTSSSHVGGLQEVGLEEVPTPTKTLSQVDSAVQDPGTRGAGERESVSTIQVGEDVRTQGGLSRLSLDASVTGKSTTGNSDVSAQQAQRSELTVGCDRGHEDVMRGLRRVYLGSSSEAKELKAYLEDQDELETAVHRSQSIYLLRLEDSVQNAEFRSILATARNEEPRGLDSMHTFRDDGGDSGEQVLKLFDKTITLKNAAESKRRRFAAAAWIARTRQKAKEKELSAAARAIQGAQPVYNPVSDDWESEKREVDSKEEKERALKMDQPIGAQQWLGAHCGQSGFTGQGYGLTVKQFEASRLAASFNCSESKRLSGGQLRQLKRELRAVDGEEFRLGFAAFEQGAGAESIVLSDYVYSAVDSGTSITIAQLENQLAGLDKSATVKIMGFNGSVSRSKGKGRMLGVASNRDGTRVVLRVPDAHHVPGAPSDLLSVSALVAHGYEFHFTESGAWMITPEMDIIDLEEKGGLYWLKWKRSIDPLSAISEKGNQMGKVLHRGKGEPQEQDKILHRGRGESKEKGNHKDKVLHRGKDEPKVESNEMENVLHRGKEELKQSAEEERCVEVRDDEEEGDETQAELGRVESPNLGAAQIEEGWAQGAVPLSARCTSAGCAVCCGVVREREKYVSLDLLHRRLAHFDPALCDKMVSMRSLDVKLMDRHVQTCDVCKANKITRGAVPKQREEEAAQRKPFERVWTDVKGKLLKDFWGNEYMVTFTCEVTRWTCVYFCQRKSQVKERFVEFLAWVRRQGYAVSVLNSDGGGEYAANENAKVLSEFQRVCVDHGITHNMTSPDTSAQNGVSERLNRTLVEHARSVLHAAGLAREFWTLAVKHVAWVRNRIWHKALQVTDGAGMSPFQALYGRTPKVSMAKVFGCDAWRLDMSVKKGSLEPKGKKGIFVGLSANRKGWLIFDPKTRTTRTSFHCSFDESLEGRRCALRDFDLRQRKAGPGSSKDEERLALLERELYDTATDLYLSDDRLHGFSEDKEPREGQVDATNSGSPKGVVPAPDADQQRAVGEEASASSSESENEVARSENEFAQQHRSHPSRSNSGSRGGDRLRLLEIPKRRAAIGTKQDLSDEDLTFLEVAFVNDLPVEYQQRNPKSASSASRVRYEKYKGARTIREAKNKGASWEDIKWDFARGYIDFKHASGFVDLEECWQRRADGGVGLSPAAAIDESANVVFTGQFGSLTLEESIQQDYAVMALEHIESLSHRNQRLLQHALGNETLVQFAHSCAARIMLPEPLSAAEAMASEHAKEWRAAMDEEIANLARFKCFERVPRSEALKHGRLVKSKWVFKVKYEADGSVQRFRARLVAKGFTQAYGTDFWDTYSPVFSYSSLRSIFAIAADRDMQLDQFDLKNGFIQQAIDVDHLYMECPDGYPKTMPGGEAAALHCLQSIYGLKQSSRLLHQRLSKYLVSIGFKQLISDQCVYTKGSGDSQLIVCTWVDDIILASARGNEVGRKEFDRALRQEFEMSPWTSGEAGWVLNMKVVRDWKAGTIHISQPGAIEKLAAQFKLTGREGRAPWVPMDPSLKLTKPDEKDVVSASEWDYQSAVGAMLYLSLTARPDVAQCVGVLSRFMSCPGRAHVEAAKQCIRYLFATKDYGITYSKHLSGAPHVYMKAERGAATEADEKSASFEMVTYADADLAGDLVTLKSTTGFCIMLNGGLVSWSSKLQSVVALSTAEAETNAAVEAVKTVMHMRLFLQELNLTQVGPSVVYEDNASAISLAQSKEQSKRARHYQLKVHFLSDLHKRGVFCYEKVGTRDQVADAFTKALPRDDFVRFREWMGVTVNVV